MSFSNVAGSDIALIRLRIMDAVEASAVFSDEDLNAFLLAETGTWGASAAALERIALDQVLKLKYTKILGFTVDGAKVAEAILKIARSYRDQALIADSATGDLWDSAEIASTDWNAERIIIGDLLRNGY